MTTFARNSCAARFRTPHERRTALRTLAFVDISPLSTIDADYTALLLTELSDEDVPTERRDAAWVALRQAVGDRDEQGVAWALGVLVAT